MKWATVIFTYNRPDMLKATSGHMMSHMDNVLVLDDGSPYGISGGQVLQFTHGGKKMFWRQFDRAFKWARVQDATHFIFMPDDFLDLDFERVQQLAEGMPEGFAYNLINDGRTRCWGGREMREHDAETNRVYFCDGGFFCDRECLELLNWTMPKVPERWFDRPDKSSGIGYMLSCIMREKEIAIFQPKKSLAYHGTHESQMHRDERKRNPLVSR